MTSLIVGASAGLGRALAESLARRGQDLILCSSAMEDLDPLAQDLKLRFGVAVACVELDLNKLDSRSLADTAMHSKSIDRVFVVAGSSTHQDAGPVSDDQATQLIRVNYEGAVRIINFVLPNLLEHQAAQIVIISTVAANRPRGRNTVYASSKHALEFYVKGLRHRFADTGLSIKIMRVGYLDTNMGFGEKRPLPKLKPDHAAELILKSCAQPGLVAYIPGWWRPLMIVHRLLPWFIYKRINF